MSDLSEVRPRERYKNLKMYRKNNPDHPTRFRAKLPFPVHDVIANALIRIQENGNLYWSKVHIPRVVAEKKWVHPRQVELDRFQDLLCMQGFSEDAIPLLATDAGAIAFDAALDQTEILRQIGTHRETELVIETTCRMAFNSRFYNQYIEDQEGDRLAGLVVAELMAILEQLEAIYLEVVELEQHSDFLKKGDQV